MIGGKVTAACVPREIGFGIRAAGYVEIDIDHFVLDFSHAFRTGKIRVRSSGVVKDLLKIDLAMSGAMLPRHKFGRRYDKALWVSELVLGIQDNGGWQRLSRPLPENLRTPEVIKSPSAVELTNNVSLYGTRAVTAIERCYLDDLMQNVARFVRDGDEITIEAQLPTYGVFMVPEILEGGNEAPLKLWLFLLQEMAVDVRTTPIARSELLDPVLLSRIDGALNSAERLLLAEALLSGNGVPRAESVVPDILKPLMNDSALNAAQASLFMTRAQSSADPKAAYRAALVASSANLPYAVSLLDILGATLPTGAVIAAQDANLARIGAASLPVSSDSRAVRNLALQHFTGLGAPRAYRRAYYHALTAEAAGDIGAGSLREDIEARFEQRGSAVDDLWSKMRAEIQEAALSDWISKNLAERDIRDD